MRQARFRIVLAARVAVKGATASYSPTRKSFPRLGPVQSEKVFSCRSSACFAVFYPEDVLRYLPVVPVLGSSPVERYRSAIRSPP